MYKHISGIKKISFTLFFFALSALPLIAQNTPKDAEALEPHVLRVYFFMLVFAVIISRLVDYIKIIFQWLWPKIKLLSMIGEALWKTVKTKLDRLKLEYDEEKVKNHVNKTAVDIVLHILAVSIGIVFCLAFKIEVISLLNIPLENDVLKYIFSGILAGAGIGPIHSVFRMTGERRKIKELSAALSGK